MAMILKKQMYCDNLMANSVSQFSLQMFVSALESRWKGLGKCCVMHAGLGTHCLTEIDIGGKSDLEFSALTTLHINILR